MSTDLAGLAGVSLGVAGLALAARRAVDRRPAARRGPGNGVAFLGDGLMPALLVGMLALLLPATGPAWRSRAYAIAVAAASRSRVAPRLRLADRSSRSATRPCRRSGWALRSPRAGRAASLATTFTDLAYFAKILPWYAWPALPLAAWTVWRARNVARRRGTDLHLPLAATLLFFVLLSAARARRGK